MGRTQAAHPDHHSGYLRKQWHQELTEKFFLPCTLIETRSYNAAIKLGNFRPFEAQDRVVICSYHFARSKASDVSATDWDLVVIDEAHRLRNVYKPSNVIAPASVEIEGKLQQLISRQLLFSLRWRLQ